MCIQKEAAYHTGIGSRGIGGVSRNCIWLKGILLPLIANHKIKWYQALVIGILMSATIELSQLIFMRGLFEWDDMIHNGLGCMAGCLFTNNFVKSGVKH